MGYAFSGPAKDFFEDEPRTPGVTADALASGRLRMREGPTDGADRRGPTERTADGNLVPAGRAGPVPPEASAPSTDPAVDPDKERATHAEGSESKAKRTRPEAQDEDPPR